MSNIRKGRQTPTRSFILPYTVTHGARAVELYNSTGNTAIEWQELLQYDILAVNDEGLWVHTKFGYSVPRRNGKNEIIAMRELFGLVELGEHILHTAHRTDTAHTAWERLLDIVERAGITVKSSYRAFGKEHIELENGGKIDFRTRTSKGGLGTGYDLLVIDEAQEYQDDQESSLKYVVSAAQNPQTIFTGTPPTAVSSGTVFTKFRNKVLIGEAVNSGWAEWSVEKMTDVQDRDAWYETNPSLGAHLKERTVMDEIGNDDTDFNIQRLGLWLAYNQKSAITRNEWLSLQSNAMPKLKGKLFVGIKYNHDGTSVSLSIAVRTVENKIFVEAVDCQNVRRGNAWIVSFLQSADIQKIVVDGANGQSVLKEDIKSMGVKIKKPVFPTVKEIIAANATFEQGLFRGELVHMGQPSLTQSVSNCEKRAIGSNGGFGYRSLVDEIDISLLDSVVLAYWACSETKPTAKKQKITY